MGLTNHAADSSYNYNRHCACSQPDAGDPWELCGAEEAYDDGDSSTVPAAQVQPLGRGRWVQ